VDLISVALEGFTDKPVESLRRPERSMTCLRFAANTWHREQSESQRFAPPSAGFFKTRAAQKSNNDDQHANRIQ
jgi:hypothetical protein